MGRLIRVRQPEQETNSALNLADDYNTSGEWTAGFTYDVLGNVITATDANGTVITNSYDRANRVTTRTYTNEPQGQQTPAVNFYYDGKGLAQSQSPNFAKGKLTRVASSVSETQYSLFDNFGRLTESKQITDGQVYTSSYRYNLSGALIEETYPSGRVVKNEFEADGDLSRIYGTANANAAERTYANSFTYTPDGRIEKLKLGNGLWEAARFNTRLQVTELALGRGLNGDLWKLGYEYGELNTDGTVNTAKNTGNIAKQTLSFNGLAQPFVQTYEYDSVYRLTEARETNNGNQTWKEAWTYDRYGNRASYQKFVAAAQVSLDNTTNPTIDPNTNRFQTGQGYVFDKNGNLTADAQNRSSAFNGDNKQTEVRDSTNNVIGRYFYDGEGRRVKKVTDTETTIFVYSNGRLIAEYSTQPPPQNATTNYTITDQLGSPRVITNSLGDVVSRRDFMPFGEQVYQDQTYRKSEQKYDFGDNIRQKFTAYERDNESGLDFAQARYYANQHGRFTSVDPIMMTKKRLADPQSINLYAYSRNNPLKYVDPTGEYFVGTNGKRVGFKIDDKGKIVLGKNASADLVRMARLINKTGSETALAQFAAAATSETKNHFKIEEKPQNNKNDLGYGLLGYQQPYDKNGKALEWERGADGTGKFDGQPAYIKDKNGNMVYKEANITVFEGNITKSQLEAQRTDTGDPNLTKAEVVVGVASHEFDHNTNQEAIDAIRTRQEGGTNNLDVQKSAEAVEKQVFEEIKKKRP